MARLLFLIAIVVVIYLVLKSFRGRGGDKAVPTKTEDMVRCAHCGVHLPKGESILADGRHYCSDAHRRAYESGRKDPDAR